jgi:hypothetical protein
MTSQAPVLVAGGPEAVFVYDAVGGWDTRALADSEGRLTADLTILAGGDRPVAGGGIDPGS